MAQLSGSGTAEVIAVKSIVPSASKRPVMTLAQAWSFAGVGTLVCNTIVAGA